MGEDTRSGETFDPYTLTPDAVREPPSSLGQAFRQIGPGLILAGSIVGTGELINTTHVGATAGFSLLWLVIFSCFIKVFVQVELGRHAISSGETTLSSFQKLPGPGFLLPWWWLLMTACTQCQLGTMVGSVGQTGHMVFPGVSPWLAEALGGIGFSLPSGWTFDLGRSIASRPELPWAILTAVATSVLLAVGSYRIVENGTTLLVVIFTLMTVGCVALLPAAGCPIGAADITSGLSFRLPRDREILIAAVSMFGITGVGASELIMYPYWCIEKGYARNVGPRPMDSGASGWERRARGWLRVLRLDAWVSMAVYTVATLSFFLLGATVLQSHTKGRGLSSTVSGMMADLSKMYEPVLGPATALWFIVVGTFAVLYSTLFAATAANCRTVTDFLRVKGFLTIRTHDDRRRWVRRFSMGFPFLNLILFAWIGNPVIMVMIGGIAQALTLPMIGLAAVYLRYRRTDRRLAPGRAWDVLLWLSTLSLIAVAAYLLGDVYQKVCNPAG
jgi:Mn2+/Fe2+ NRAMP family transporter